MTVSFELNPECDDTDGDYVCDDTDNCVNDKNPLQEDFEHDELGDACDSDDDNDGVLDINDRCQFSVLPETVPTDHLLPNNYADIDGDGYFESVNPRSKLITDNSIPFSKTFGCSCKEILATKPGDTFGELKFGCTKGTMEVWAAGGGGGKKSENRPYPRSKGEILNMKPGEDEGEHKHGGTKGIHKVRSNFGLLGKVRESTLGFGRVICSNLEEVG